MLVDVKPRKQIVSVATSVAQNQTGEVEVER